MHRVTPAHSPDNLPAEQRSSVAFAGAFRTLDLTEEALEHGLLGAARITLAACLTYAAELVDGALRSMLLAEWARLLEALAIATARSSLA